MRYPCPCCGRQVFEEPPGSYEICPVCNWEDDPVQIRDPDYPGGANRVSLVDAQRNYATVGASEERYTEDVRRPLPDQPRDARWRPWDPALDSPPGARPFEAEPDYYWRRQRR